MGMQTRLTFQCLRRAIESTLICPATRDALEQIAKFVPSGKGPQAEIVGGVLFIDSTIWRFRTPADTRRFAELLETYFRNFDPNYRINALEQAVEATASVRSS